jgi:hypothetical protein
MQLHLCKLSGVSKACVYESDALHTHRDGGPNFRGPTG